MIWLKLFLLPFSLIYGLVVFCRNKAFDVGLLKSQSYDFPVISIGNLCSGGSGKTPHVEYLLRLIGGDKKTSVLSRGYGRNSTGFVMVKPTSNAKIVGDEPLQIARKFPDTDVAVCEKRTVGIEKLNKNSQEILILDDAYQHRYVNAGLNILLTNYDSLYINDYMLPSGNLRESKSQSKRADIIIVTNSPKPLLPLDEYRLNEQIFPHPNQKLFFSSVYYLDPKSVFTDEKVELQSKDVILLTGIANAKRILDYVSERATVVQHLEYADHHCYKDKDVKNIIRHWNSVKSAEKLILTTEKDAVKLQLFKSKFEGVTICYIPIEIKFQGKNNFNDLILKYVKENSFDN
jgi:tetraacyldisaccharide 4'-kinase